VTKIVECVPNFSEGRRKPVVDALAAALTSVPGVALLDAEMDAAHHRSVISVAGDPQAVAAGVLAAVGKAVELIDLRTHQGEHPRMGAADVIPFVPISGLTLEECVQLSVETAEKISERYRIPTYLYEQSARVPARQDLAYVRKGEFEVIRDEIRTDPARKPDFGPCEVHPSAGATAVGARFPLIAYNIYLGTADLKVAQAIARAVRGSSGGLRFVKALGFEIKERNQVQVSMNLTRYQATPIFRVFEMVKREAARYGVPVVSSEIVGLVPQKALEACADYYLQLEGFSSRQILEVRLAETLSREPAVEEFLAGVAAPEAVPGGGSAAAFAGSLAAALGEMVAGLTEGRKSFQTVEETVHGLHQQLSDARNVLQELVREDAASYRAVMEAMQLPKTTEAERASREDAIQRAMRLATETPLRTARAAEGILKALETLVALGNPNARSDAASGAQLAFAALKSAEYNVLTNLPGLKDPAFAQGCRREVAELRRKGEEILGRVDSLMTALGQKI